MGVLLGVSQLKHSFGAHTLFDGLTFSLSDGEKVALVGANGAGKSTLLKILAGKMNPDSGNVSRSRGLRVGYLPQVPTFTPGLTVREAIYEGIDMEGDWEAISAAEESISRLEIRTSSGSIEDKLVAELSGGWQKKVALARELAHQPDVLLLDEPTNHLDIDSIFWLESYIRSASICVLTISHDRAFLRKIADRVIEVDRRNPNGILSIDGGFDTFLTVKEEYLENQAAREASLSNTLRREVEWLRRGAKARTTKQKARIDRTFDLQDEVSDLRSKMQSREAKLEFTAQEGGPKKLIEAENISKGYDGRTLFKNLSLKITPKTRLGLLGRNGAGKSSLIRVLVGEEDPDNGTVELSDRLQVAYFEQNRDRLDPEVTLLRTICPYGETVEFQGRKIHVRSYLERFLFTQQQGDLQVGRLSGGEQSRVLLALLMMSPANLLILDEPTNDLDLPTLALLEDCLSEFGGAVILVSHDRAFLSEVCNQILAFPELHTFSDMDQWETWKRKDMANAKKGGAAIATSSGSTGTPPAPANRRKLNFKEQREFDMMELTIQQQEEKVAELSASSISPEVLKSPSKQREILAKLTESQKEVERLYARWSELESLGGKKSG